jgi:DNA-binding NarL/FixJ family response regulator
MTQPLRIKVLIAHGDPLISAGLAAILQRRYDFEALVCSPPLTQSRTTSRHLPPADVVVADYELGLQLIVSRGALSNRVIVLTHSDSEAKICRAVELGARGYLLLGCSLEELIDALRSVYIGNTALAPLVASRIANRMSKPALTGREEDILRGVMLGRSNKAIAANLAMALGTVKTHVKSILVKLDAASRTEAVAIAQRRGILGDDVNRLSDTKGQCNSASAQAPGSRARPGIASLEPSLWLRTPI